MPSLADAPPFSRRVPAFRAGMLLVALCANSMALAAPSELKRSDSLDMRRAGKVSEDERSVLRIEWRVGMSGVEESRTLQDMLDKLRQMEKNAAAVGQAFRSMPVERRAPPPTQALVQESRTTTDGQTDWRLMGANATALVLVAVWWFSRRKAQKADQAVAEEITAKLRAEPVVAPEAVAPKILTQEAFAATAELHAFDFAQVSDIPPQDEPAAAPALEPSESSQVIDFNLPDLKIATEAPSSDSPPGAEMTVPSAATARPQLEESPSQPDVIAQTDKLAENTVMTVDGDAVAPKDAIHHMLKLLGIYRKRGMRQEFQETAEKLRKNFNIQAADWDHPDEGALSLENFPRIAEHVCATWSRPQECSKYLRQLIEDNRDGARAGFPQSVAEEMLLLVEIQEELAGRAQAAG